MTRSRGFTVVELLMAVAVFGIGVSGIIALQKITVVSNQHAKNLATATRIAQSWSGQLLADASLWNHPSPRQANTDLAETVWLNQVTQGNAWFQPAYNAARDFGPAFDALGNVVNPATDPLHVQYCTHLRLTSLFPGTNGSGVIRAEIRVFWPREGQPLVGGQPLCGTSSNPTVIGQAITNYHFVYVATAINQQTLP